MQSAPNGKKRLRPQQSAEFHFDPNVQIQFVERAGPYGSSVNPHKLPITELKLHLKGRGRDPFGLRRDLEQELKRALEEESKEAWDEYQARRLPIREPVRKLIEEFKEEREEPELDLAMLNAWLNSGEVEFNWNTHEDSLAHKLKVRKETYPVPLEKLRESIDPFPTETRAEVELRLEQEEIKARANRSKLLAEKESNSCTWTAPAPGQYKKYVCTNPRQVLRDHYADHIDATYCAYHSTCCASMNHVPTRALAARAQKMEEGDIAVDVAAVDDMDVDSKANSKGANAKDSEVDVGNNTSEASTTDAETNQLDAGAPEPRDEVVKRPRIVTPNELGFCVECYFAAKKRRPVKTTTSNVPGLILRTDEALKALKEAGKAITEGTNLTAPTSGDIDPDVHVGGALQRQEEAMKTFLCKWRATDGEGNKLGCQNMRIRDPLTGVMARRCGYHTRTCGMAHIDRVVKNEIPNELGVCVRHYVARRREKPESEWEVVNRIPQFPGVYVMELAPPVSSTESNNGDQEGNDQNNSSDSNINQYHTLRQRIVRALVEYAKQQMQQIREQTKTVAIQTKHDLITVFNDISQDMYIPTLLAFGKTCKLRSKEAISRARDHVPTYETLQQHLDRVKSKARSMKFLVKSYKTRKPNENDEQNNGDDSSSNTQDGVSLSVTPKRRNMGLEHTDSKRSLGSRVHMMFSHVKRKDLIKATVLIQRFTRARMGRFKFFFQRKAIQVQRIVRGHLGRCAAKAERLLRDLRYERLDWEWAKGVLENHLLGYAVRIRTRKLRQEVLRHRNAASCLQRSWLHYLMKRELCRNLHIFAIRNRAAKLIQMVARYYIEQMRLYNTRAQRDHAASNLQKLYRGWKGREKSLAQVCEMEKYWTWVGSSVPRSNFLSLLKRSRYRTRHETSARIANAQELTSNDNAMSTVPPKAEGDIASRKIEQQPNRITVFGNDSKPNVFSPLLEKQQPNWSIEMFAQFDDGRSGFVRRDEFERVIRGVPNASSLFSKTQIERMLKLWTEQDGLVNYFSFLRLARSEQHVCSTHRCWVCPVCAIRGRCTKCTCSKFHPTEVKGPKSLICSTCNHYITMHQVVARPRLDKDFKEGETISSVQLSQILRARQGFVDPPTTTTHKHQIRERTLAMHYEFDDLHSGLEHPNNSAPKMIAVKVTNSKSTAQEYLHGICEDIVRTLITESKNSVAKMRRKEGWNGVGQIDEASKAIQWDAEDGIAKLPDLVKRKALYADALKQNANKSAGGTARSSTSFAPQLNSVRARKFATPELESNSKLNLGIVAQVKLKASLKPRPSTAHVLTSVKRTIRKQACLPNNNKAKLQIKRKRATTAIHSKRRTSKQVQNSLVQKAQTALQKLHHIEEQRVVQGETVPGEQLGPLLLANAKDPHAMAHHKLQNDIATSKGIMSEENAARSSVIVSQAPRYVQRTYRAEVRRKQLIVEIGDFTTTLRQFAFEFSVADPVPLIVNDTLQLTIDTAPLYVDMLLSLSMPECQLLDDTHALVAYIYQSFSFIQRHWRKLVHDIRTGTLDPQVNVHPNVRVQVESILQPQPERSQIFDSMLRELGFYRFSTGVKPASKLETILKAKMVQIQKEDRAKWSNGSDRRHSMPLHLLTKPSLNSPSSTKKQASNQASSVHGNEKSTAAETTTPCLPLVNVGDHRRSSLQPVVPEDDTAPELYSHLDTYLAQTRPRVDHDPVIKVTSRKSRSYRCTHPGCGQSFTHRVIAEQHAKTYHYGRYRLAVKREEVDELMRFHWPIDIPWSHANSKQTREEKEETKLAEVIAKPYKCQRVECGRRFCSTKELKLHNSVSHVMHDRLVDTLGVVEPSKNVEFTGPATVVPPALPPRRVGVPCCSKHWVLLVPYCRECLPLIQARVPMCPIKFYESGRVELPESRGSHKLKSHKIKCGGLLAVKLQLSLLNIAGGTIGDGIEPTRWEPQVEHLQQNRAVAMAAKHESSLHSKSSEGIDISHTGSSGNVSDRTTLKPSSKEKPKQITVLGNVVAFLTDKLGRKFVAYSTYRKCKDLKQLGVSNLASNMNRNHELVEELQVRFAPVSSIIGTEYVLTCDREEFRRRQLANTLPTLEGRRKVFFSQDMFCARKLQVVGERTTMYFRSKLHTGLYIAETDDGVYGVLRQDFYSMKKLQNTSYNRQVKSGAS